MSARVVASAGVFALLLALGATTGCGSGDSGERTSEGETPTEASEATTDTDPAPPAEEAEIRLECGGDSVGQLFRRTQPAEIVVNAGTTIDGYRIARGINGWRIRTPRLQVVVQAGAADREETTGAFVVSRFRACPLDIARMATAELIEVPGGGALKITDGPQGEVMSYGEQSSNTGVSPRVARHAKLDFSGRDGLRGTLNLSDNTITCARPRPSCRALKRTECPSPDFDDGEAPSAHSIGVWAIDCEAARSFIGGAPGGCFERVDGDGCQHDGFECTLREEPFSSTITPVVCQSGAQRIEFSWFHA